MKLYTEDQVNKIAWQVKDLGYWNHLEITPIELPSDEEIKQKFTVRNQIFLDRIDGAKWMRDLIQAGGKP